MSDIQGEMVKAEPSGEVVVQRHYASGNDLVSIIHFGNTLIGTGFFPKAVKTGAQAAAIILTGRELGIPEMQSLRSINIIEGKPSLAADLMLGLFLRDGGKVAWKRSDATAASLDLTRKDGTTASFTFTMDEAKAAGLAAKDNWRRYPAAMLRARVITASLRAFAPDSGFAGVYDPDEIDPAPAEYSEVQPATAEEIPEEPPTNPQWRPVPDVIKGLRSAKNLPQLDAGERWLAQYSDLYTPAERQPMHVAASIRRKELTPKPEPSVFDPEFSAEPPESPVVPRPDKTDYCQRCGGTGLLPDGSDCKLCDGAGSINPAMSLNSLLDEPQHRPPN